MASNVGCCDDTEDDLLSSDYDLSDHDEDYCPSQADFSDKSEPTETDSPSQNWSPEGNGVHFMFGVVSRPIFPEESHGADHFLKKGAQRAHLGRFWAHGSVQIKNLVICQ